MPNVTASPPQPTKSLAHFNVLIGEWDTVGTHPALPASVSGRTTFEWLVQDALLIWRFDWAPSQIPSAVIVIGHDDTADDCTLLYSDVRGVARIYYLSFDGATWKMWRNSGEFSQRMSGSLSADNNTLTVHGELSRDGAHWEGDLDVVYTRRR